MNGSRSVRADAGALIWTRAMTVLLPAGFAVAAALISTCARSRPEPISDAGTAVQPRRTESHAPVSLEGGSVDPFAPAERLAKGTRAVQIVAGAYHSCALLDDGTVRCWGRNELRQLGDGTQFDRTVPVRVVGITDAVEIATKGGLQTCARLRDGTVRCWGEVPGEPFELPAVHDAVALVTDTYRVCALRPSGDLTCAGSKLSEGGPPSPRDALFWRESEPDASLTQITLDGWAMACGLGGDGSVVCWQRRPRPRAARRMQLPRPATQIAMGGTHACALLDDSTFACWGRDAHGELWDPNLVNADVPVPAVGMRDVVRLAANYSVTCALGRSGSVVCRGAAGTNKGWVSHVPFSPDERVLPDGSGAVDLVSGFQHVCVLLRDGGVRCAGRESSGALGDGRAIPRCNEPNGSPWHTGIPVRLDAPPPGPSEVSIPAPRKDDRAFLPAGIFDSCPAPTGRAEPWTFERKMTGILEASGEKSLWQAARDAKVRAYRFAIMYAHGGSSGVRVERRAAGSIATSFGEAVPDGTVGAAQPPTESDYDAFERCAEDDLSKLPSGFDGHEVSDDQDWLFERVRDGRYYAWRRVPWLVRASMPRVVDCVRAMSRLAGRDLGVR